MALTTHEINVSMPPIYGELPGSMYEDVDTLLTRRGASSDIASWEKTQNSADPLVGALRPLIEVVTMKHPDVSALDIEVSKQYCIPGADCTGSPREWHYDDDVHYAMTADTLTTRQLYIPDTLSAERRAEALIELDSARYRQWFFNQNMIEEGIKAGLYAVARSRPRGVLMMKNAIHQEPTNNSDQPIDRTFIRAQLIKD